MRLSRYKCLRKGLKVLSKLMGTALAAALFVLTFIVGGVIAQEVITEIRFRAETLEPFPNEGYFKVIDINGDAHTIDVKKNERIEIVSASHYKGPKQYATDYRGYTYEKVRIAGEYYHWFFLPELSSESPVVIEIKKMIQRD